MSNYTVQARLEVRADSTDAAREQVVDALRRGYKGSGIGPVVDLRVAEGATLLDKLPATQEGTDG